MDPVGTGRAERRVFARRKLGVLMTLVSVSAAALQSRSSAPSGISPFPLQKSCLSQPSEQIAGLLESIRDHPTAGAWDTLGVLYAHADHVSCAIPAFENAIQLAGQDWEPHYNLALALARTGNRVRAKRELQMAIRLKPDSVSSHFALGSILQDEGRFEEAGAEFRSALSIDSTFVPAALQLSQVLLAQGKPRAAIAGLEEAARQKLPPGQSESIQAALGMAYAEGGDMANALATLEVLVAAQPDSADAQFRLGLLYDRRDLPSDQEAAAQHYREALRLDPKMDAARLALAHSLLSSQQYSQALTVLQEYIAHDSGSAPAWYLLGVVNQALGQVNAALEAFRKTTILDPRDSQARYELGVLLARAGKDREALSQLQTAERLSPRNPQVHRELATLLARTGNSEAARKERTKVAALESGTEREAATAKLTEEANRSLSAGNAQAAAETYRKALQLHPDDPKLHYNLSLALDQLGDLAAERKELEKAVALEPNLAAAQNQLGLLALGKGAFDEAEQRFKKALAIDPKFAEAAGNLAVAYSQLGNDAEAAKLFQEAIRQDPKYTKAYVNFGLLMAQKRAFNEAEQQFRTAIQVDPSYADAYAALGMVQAKTGRSSEAVQSLQKVVALEPGSARAHLNLGIALVDSYDRAAGWREFSEAVRLDPTLPAAHYNLGRFFYETGKYEDAQRELVTALRLQPDSADAAYFLALTERQNGDVERSTQLLFKVVQLQPGNADAQYLLGQNLDRQGNTAGAVEHWKQAVQADPNHSQALYNLAKALNKLADPEAQKYQDRFDALQKNQQITDRVQQLGNFALEAANAQNWPQAEEQMTEAIRLCGTCPQSAQLHRNLGLIYGRTGRIEEAERELHTALELDPQDVDAHKALSVLERLQAVQGK
jgi:tetratricopeptide (TPR) repeat protein